MERIMKAQALSDNSSMGYMMSKKNFEINPFHPIIRELKDKLVDDDNRSMASNLVNILYETALINSGFTLEKPTTFTNRIYNMVRLGLGLSLEEEEEISSEDHSCSSSSCTDIPSVNTTCADTQCADTQCADTQCADTTQQSQEEEMEQVD